MTDYNFDDAARALESRDTLTGTFDLGGDEYPLEVREPTLDELEELEAGLADQADEVEAIREMVDQYLLAPEVQPGDVGISKLRALFGGMREAWEAGEAFDEARAEMPLDEGNGRRRSSRR